MNTLSVFIRRSLTVAVVLIFQPTWSVWKIVAYQIEEICKIHIWIFVWLINWTNDVVVFVESIILACRPLSLLQCCSLKSIILFGCSFNNRKPPISSSIGFSEYVSWTGSPTLSSDNSSWSNSLEKLSDKFAFFCLFCLVAVAARTILLPALLFASWFSHLFYR